MSKFEKRASAVSLIQTDARPYCGKFGKVIYLGMRKIRKQSREENKNCITYPNKSVA